MTHRCIIVIIYHLFLVSLNSLLENLSVTLASHIHLIVFVSAICSLSSVCNIFFNFYLHPCKRLVNYIVSGNVMNYEL